MGLNTSGKRKRRQPRPGLSGGSSEMATRGREGKRSADKTVERDAKRKRVQAAAAKLQRIRAKAHADANPTTPADSGREKARDQRASGERRRAERASETRSGQQQQRPAIRAAIAAALLNPARARAPREPKRLGSSLLGTSGLSLLLQSGILNDEAEEIARNAKREAGEIARGVPKAAYVNAKATGEDLAALREGDPRFRELRREVVEPTAKGYARKYGPLLPGGRPARETWEQIKREPISTTLDVGGVGSIAASAPTKVAKALATKGGPVKRYRASKTLPPPRHIQAGKARVQLPTSPSPVTRAFQRGRDRLSERMGTAPARASKQKAKELRQDVRRREAAFAGDARSIRQVGGRPGTFRNVRGRAERTGLFWEAQMPAELRGGKGLKMLADDLRHERDAALKAGDARRAKRLDIQARKAERAIGKRYDPEAIEAASRLMDERERIFREAGKLNEETAAGRKELLTRKLHSRTVERDRTPEEVQTRLAELDRQYDGMIARLGRAIDPYPSTAAKRAEVARRNKRGSRRSRAAQPTVSAEIRKLAEEKLDELVVRNPDHPVMRQAAALIRERDELRAQLNAVGEASIEGTVAPSLGRVPEVRMPDVGEVSAEGAVYVGHRTRQAPRAIQRLGQTRPGLGKTKTPPGIGQRNELRAYRSGRIITDPDEIVRDWQRAQVYDFHNRTKDFLGQMGERIVDRPKQGWYVVNPQGHKLPREWKDADPDELAVREGFDPADAVYADAEEYVKNYIAKAGTPEAEKLLRASPESVVQVPPQVVNKFYNRFTGQPGVGFGATAKAAQAFDVTNDLMRASLIYANPGYVPANLVGNTLFAVAHQGPFFLPGNLARSANVLTGRKTAELRDRVRAEIGMGASTSIASGARGKVAQGVQKLAKTEGLVADDWLRAAAWLHEARKAGYRSSDKQLKLLRDAERGNKRAREIANELRDRVNVAMVDFERLGPFERGFASRAMFVWPWMRGASRYPFRFALDYPGRSALIAQQAEETDRDPELQLDDVPHWLEQAFPAGPVEGGLRKIINPRSVSTTSTPLELMQTLAGGLVGGEGDEALLDLASPGIRLGARALTGRNRFGQRVGAVEAVKQDAKNLSPAFTLAEELYEPDRSPKIYGPQDRAEVLKRRVGRGALPIQIDVDRARQQADLSPVERARFSVEDRRAAYFEEARRLNLLPKDGKLPKPLQEAFAVEQERQTLYAKATEGIKTGTPEFHRARFEADGRLLLKYGKLTREQFDKGKRWASRASLEDLKEERRRISEHFYQDEDDGFLPVIADARKYLQEHGAKGLD